MNCHVIATLVGIILQILGAGYLVWQARFTAIKLAKYKSNITYDNFGTAIDDLAQEINGQFKQQMRGFLLVGAGSLLQFYGAWPT
jgi:CHASE3 domain sensor protein